MSNYILQHARCDNPPLMEDHNDTLAVFVSPELANEAMRIIEGLRDIIRLADAVRKERKQSDMSEAERLLYGAISAASK